MEVFLDGEEESNRLKDRLESVAFFDRVVVNVGADYWKYTGFPVLEDS